MIWQKQLLLESQLNRGVDAFLDRSIIDGLAYCEIFNLNKHSELINAAHKSNYSIIFILDFLKSFDVTNIRLETTNEALKIHKKIKLKYWEIGYELITVPAFCVDEYGCRLSMEKSNQKRLNFIFQKIKNYHKKEILRSFKKPLAQFESLL
jgi:predicted ATPase